MAPMNDSEVTTKFTGLFRNYHSEAGAARMIELVENLDDLDDIAALFTAFARPD